MTPFQWIPFTHWSNNHKNYIMRLFSFGTDEDERALVHIDFGYGDFNENENPFADIGIGDGSAIHFAFRVFKADFLFSIWSV